MGTATGQSPKQDILSRVAPAVTIATNDEVTVFRAPYTGVISGVSYVPDTLITGANTNTRRVSVINKGQAGAGVVEAAALQFDSGVNATAFDEKALTLSGTASNLNVVEGDIVSFKSVAVGTGIVDPGGTVFITITRD